MIDMNTAHAAPASTCTGNCAGCMEFQPDETGMPFCTAEPETLGVAIIDGVQVLNATPHPCTFQDAAGEVVSVPANPAFLVNAKPVEAPAGAKGLATLVGTKFVADEASLARLAQIEAEFPNAIIVGSMISAQALPGRVFSMVPVPGFERRPPAEKRMRVDKFTTYGGMAADAELIGVMNQLPEGWSVRRDDSGWTVISEGERTWFLSDLVGKERSELKWLDRGDHEFENEDAFYYEG